MPETIQIDYSMDAIKRLEKEIEYSNEKYTKIIGGFLIGEMQKDESLKKNYFDKKILLKDVVDFVFKNAKKMNSSSQSCVAVEDNEVYGWAIHFIQDEECEVKTDSGIELSRETKEELIKKAEQQFLEQQKCELEEKAKKAEERAKKMRDKELQKEKNENDQNGQMSIFEL